ncbi:signal peptidase II [Thalassotalea sp. ND16A]|uniref:signal peptidase II n=1 Tax=Thalassotalea sp. ND16A TaxID=1535422 RepID=UPI00051DA700|nr:signal peptidase II [Thalassotalea sp. ND16A]KGJ88265.1 Signal peptidase II [Thalassotalea sp. ND16A]
MSDHSVFKNTGLRWLWLAIILLIVDQVTKHTVVAFMDYRESIAIMPFFNLTYVHNPGAAFSFLADQGGWQRWFFTIIAAVVSVLLVVWMAKTPKQDKLIAIAFALILSGAVGNLIDRMLFGYVIDFLDFYYGSKHWPAFNVADSAIFVGAGLMIFDALFYGDKSDDKSGNKNGDTSNDPITDKNEHKKELDNSDSGVK